MSEKPVGEDWELLKTFLPSNWRFLARRTDAIKGLGQDKSEENCLRTLLIHLACGYSLRETVVRARAVFGNLTGEDARPTLWRGRPRPRCRESSLLLRH